ncbi:cysteine dioxygenase family protein [Verrucomicrobiaceae bacterium R5-34]|uniref:Cysteine dioxygenase family protein n=1 Tax=Oceaniferula flava TaxID=2800421 RepID=A0AAE2VCI9_9BACT|nr:cysteine dioxygenase family protein [Oceaniferula flavus]MBK1830037.1 cysteine dioxygenase family protein [Verrucomicrobiaceae bacterium R5-34]MBK1855116.1 cysteine dioxygenase family protein [Oceaniferula flavus]MBM1136422.1 cysteine dioxygenase family protein [Oceaniferula flavus]
MMTVTFPEKLQPLIDYLAQVKHRPDMEVLRQHMLEADVTAEDMGEFVQYNASGYRRNMVFESDAVELLCLCWKSGQRSPIHDHASSVCGVKIIEGTGTETVFERTPSGYIKAVSSEDYSYGQVLVSEDADIHQVANLQSTDQDLVTLHIYSPPLRSMKTWMIDSPKTKIYEPINEGHIDGCGI